MASALGRKRGIYTKVGQALATRPDFLPEEVRTELARLERSAPARPFEEIRRAVDSALGSRVGKIARIDPAPLGTASIAQVHRAVLSTGEHVVLKVRHRELTPERTRSELAALRPWLLRGARAFGVTRADLLLDEVADALIDELDFAREGRIAEEIAGVFSGDRRVRVPRVYNELCAEGVLTLEYVPALPLDDASRLRARGLDPAELARIVADAYGRQVFGEGSFHADPHAGNVLAVDPGRSVDAPETGVEPEAKVLFVDFGLSRRLEPELRNELRSGLHALLRRDVPGMVAGLKRIGAVIPDREADAARALERALGAGADTALGASAEGIDALVQLGKQLVREAEAFRIPRGLVLYARTLAHVLTLTRRIDPETDATRQLLPHLLRFLAG